MMFALAVALALQPSAPRVPCSLPLAAAQDSRTHEDTRYGFKLKPPKDWTGIPLKTSENWQIAKYLCPRDYFWTDKDSGWTREHKPELTVIAFVERKPEDKAGETKKDAEAVVIVNPYKDYEDYLERTYNAGGFYIAADEKGEVEGVPVRKLDIKVEKLTYSGPRRICTWIFDTPQVDFAVQFEMLEDAWGKLKKEAESSLKSFRLIPREGGPLEAAADTLPLDTFTGLSELSPFERRVRRQQQEKELHEKAMANVPAGWTCKRMGRFVVINHSDDRCATRMVENGEALLGWLDQKFAFVGPEEYVRAPILRICKDWEEESAMHSGSGWSWSRMEIVTHDPRDNWFNWSYGTFNRQLFDLWFSERDHELYWAMPPWLRNGLNEVSADAVVKNGKVEFKDDGWDRDELRERVRDGTLRSPKELIQMTSSTSYENRDWGTQYDFEALMRFFVGPAAQKSSRTKEVLANYTKHLKAVIDEIKAEEKKKGDAKTPPAKPKTEAEEEEQFAKQRTVWKEREQRVVDEVFKRTFSAWSDKDWEDFEKVYFKSML